MLESWQKVIVVNDEVEIHYPASDAEKRELRSNERPGDAKETADMERWSGRKARFNFRSAAVYCLGKLVGVWDSSPVPDCDEIPGGAPHMRIWGYLSHKNADTMKLAYVRNTRKVFETLWRECESDEIRAAIILVDGAYVGAVKWLKKFVGNVVSDKPAEKLIGYRVVVLERPGI